MLVIIAIKPKGKDPMTSKKTIEREISKLMASPMLDREYEMYEMKTFYSVGDFVDQMFPGLSCRGEIKSALKSQLVIRDV